MCGALSGFHALIASGTTPKMINKESDMLPIGYGAMLLEGCVSLMALVAACALEPGDYFAINLPQPRHLEQQAAAEASERGPENAERDAFVRQRTRSLQEGHYATFANQTKARHQWDLAPVELTELEAEAHESLLGRTGGAVTLAVGMAKVFASLPGMRQLMAYWYHFVIMFEALFILTLLETGTRVARFVFQETLVQFGSRQTLGHKPKWGINVGMSLLVCFLWGYLLYTGNLNALWRMLGIANQLLALIALIVGTSYLLKRSPKKVYALCTAIPFCFVLVTVFTAGVQSILSWWDELSQPGISVSDAFYIKLMCFLAGTMLVLTAVITVDGLRSWYTVLRKVPQSTEVE